MQEFHLEGKYADELLTNSNYATKSQNQTENRMQIEYKPMFERFVNEDTSFNKQYNSLYETRLKETRPLLIEAVKRKWGENVELLHDICQLVSNKDCVIIGTIYKELSLFKSVLNEKASSAFNPQLIGTQFLPKNSLHGPLSQEGDPIILEDSTTRILLKSFPDPIVTGVVLAVRGYMDDNGDFMVTSVCYVHDTIDKCPSSSNESAPKDPYLLCVSGLMIGASLNVRTHLLFEFISSQIGFVEDVKLSSHIGHVILLGNSSHLLREPFQHIRPDPNILHDSLSCVDNLDVILSEILPSVPVTIVPGNTDATSILIPQQPLHPSLFPRSLRYSSLECATNPYMASFNGSVFMMTSGQNIVDIARQVPESLSTIDLLAATLRWGNLFPTNPNTCPGYPFSTKDPFIVGEIPSVYVVGNQTAFEVDRRVIDGKTVTLISLPSFAASGTAVMVNLRTLSVTPICFDTTEMEEEVKEEEEKKVEEEDVIIDEDIANEEDQCCVYFHKQLNWT